MSYEGDQIGVDLSKHPTAKKLVDRCISFLNEVSDLTPGAPLESYLNTHYGPSNAYYLDFCRLIRQGIKNKEGWCATIPIDGDRYRRSKLMLPCEETRFFSVTTVYMEDFDSDSGSEEGYRGQYHKHPYGEINCVIQMEEGSEAELRGMQGWQKAGWTSPGAGTHHYPEVRGGALVALFFLPAGRISYKAKPDEPQPVSL